MLDGQSLKNTLLQKRYLKKERERIDLNATPNKRVRSEISRFARLTFHAHFPLRPTCDSKEVIHPPLVPARFPLSWMAAARLARASRFYFRRQQRDSRISRTIITYPLDGKFPFSRKRRIRRGIITIDSQT